MKAKIEIEFEDDVVKHSIDYIHEAYLNTVRQTALPFPSFKSFIDGRWYVIDTKRNADSGKE